MLGLEGMELELQAEGGPSAQAERVQVVQQVEGAQEKVGGQEAGVKSGLQEEEERVLEEVGVVEEAVYKSALRSGVVLETSSEQYLPLLDGQTRRLGQGLTEGDASYQHGVMVLIR